MVPLWWNTHNFTLFYKNLIEVIQNAIFAWSSLTRSIIELILKKTLDIECFFGVFFASVKTLKPYKRHCSIKLTLYLGIRRLFTTARGRKSFWQREELPDMQQHIMLGQLGLLPPQAMCPTLLMDVATPKTRTSDLPLNQPWTTLLHVLPGSDTISS